MTRLHWRSLRVQVLLWTALPLTIFLIAISLTGIGSHQASMRALAAEETERLANAVATGLAAQMESYQVGLEAAAGRAGAPYERPRLTRCADCTDQRRDGQYRPRAL